MSEWQFNNYSPYLSHYGILGQKWGVRRYQYADGTLTPAGRKRYRVTDTGDLVRKTRSEMKSDARKARKEAADKKRQTRLEREHETEEKKKERIAKSRDPKKIYENKDLFNYKELSDLYNIMNVERNIKGLIPKHVSKGEKYVKNMELLKKGIGSTVGVMENVSKGYDAVAKVVNAFTSENDSKLPIINKGDGGKKKKKKQSNDSDD